MTIFQSNTATEDDFLNKIDKTFAILEDKKDVSLDVIKNIFEQDKTELLINFLEQKLAEFKRNALHLLVSFVSYLLVLLYRSVDNYKRSFECFMLCNFPKYSINLRNFCNKGLLDIYKECGAVNVSLDHSTIPLKVSCKFINSICFADSQLSIYLTLRSEFNYEINISQVRVSLYHSTQNEITVGIKDNILIDAKKDMILNEHIQELPEGIIEIKSVIFKIYNVEITMKNPDTASNLTKIPIFANKNNNQFEIVSDDNGLIDIGYSINIRFFNPSKLVKKVKFCLSIKDSKRDIAFFDNALSDVSECFETNKEPIEFKNTLTCRKECDVELEIIGIIYIEDLEVYWNRSKYISFKQSFTHTISILYQENSVYRDGYRVINYGSEFVCLVNLKYNGNEKITINSIDCREDYGNFNIKCEIFEPVTLSTSESTSVLIYLTSSQITNEPVSCGALELYIDNSRKKFTIPLSQVFIDCHGIDIHTVIPNEIEMYKEYAFQLCIEPKMSDAQVEIIISENENFLTEGDTYVKYIIKRNQNAVINSKFMAINFGELTFPTITVNLHENNNKIPLFEKKAKIYVRS